MDVVMMCHLYLLGQTDSEDSVRGSLNIPIAPVAAEQKETVLDSPQVVVEDFDIDAETR